MIIGLTGFAGSGKTAVADVLTDIVPNTKKVSFADCVKREYAKSRGITLCSLYSKEKEEYREDLNIFADYMKLHYGPNYFFKQTLKEIEETEAQSCIPVIDDCRYKHEFMYLLPRGKVFYIRPTFVGYKRKYEPRSSLTWVDFINENNEVIHLLNYTPESTANEIIATTRISKKIKS